MTDNDGDVKMQDNNNNNNNDNEVDLQLYDRQVRVLGHEAMISMQKSSVLICGMNGLGVEIAKNVILAGIKSVTILDNTPSTYADLSSNFYLNEQHVKNKVPRAEAIYSSLKELNRYVNLNIIKGTDLTENIISSKKYNLVVLVNYSLDEQVNFNNICNKNNVKFLSCEALGVLGYVFNDFNNNFQINDTNGENPKSAIIQIIEKKTKGVICCNTDNRHDLEVGDYVTFEEIEGMVELNELENAVKVTKIMSPFAFEIDLDLTKFNDYVSDGKFIQEKQKVTENYNRLIELVDNESPPIVMSDYGKDPYQRHLLYKAINLYRKQNNNRLPSSCNLKENLSVVQIYEDLLKKDKNESYLKNFDDKMKNWVFNMSRTSSAVINPMAATLGGIVGQEILKACTGKFTPIKQFFYIDVFESLPLLDIKTLTDDNNLSQFRPLNSRYDSNIMIYGKDIQQKLHDSKLFLVGSGAIGCEMLKNFALLGIGCNSKEGKVYITDMDNIEISNLNRQFLFRSNHVGKPKSITAASVIKQMNPQINIIPQENRVGESTENIYNDTFWSSLTCVCNALDNINARLYVDTQCVNYRLPLLESGTLGTKGNTQIVVPSVTESYGSQRDPPEKDIPICTLKNFPYEIQHTIQWARDDFEGSFNKIPDEINQYLTDPKYLEKLSSSSSSELQTLKDIKSYLVDQKPIKFEDCVHYARKKFEIEYNNKIRQLLYNFPIDSLTQQGNKFWSGNKRAPSPITFDENDKEHLNYIISAANLYAYVFRLKGTKDLDTIKKFIRTCKLPKFKPKEGVKIASNDEEMKEMKENTEEDDYDETINNLKKSLPAPKDLAGFELAPIDFEKDDDTNFHIDYITACSNLRARNYRIKEASRHETKGIAGKIIPAIATTTALVTGLIIFEYFKIIQNFDNIELYRNAFINLALPLCVLSEPSPCGKTTLMLKNNTFKYEYSLWDKIEVSNGKKMTLQGLIDYIENTYGLEVSMVSYGPAILYAFFHSNNKKQKRLKAKLRKLVEAVTETKLEKTKKYLMFEMGLTDENDEDIEVPTIRVDISC